MKHLLCVKNHNDFLTEIIWFNFLSTLRSRHYYNSKILPLSWRASGPTVDKGRAEFEFWPFNSRNSGNLWFRQISSSLDQMWVLFPKVTFLFQNVTVHSLKPKPIQEIYLCAFKVQLKFLVICSGNQKATREKLTILRYAFN